jgi:hypothetical protein
VEFGVSLPNRGALATPDLVLKIVEKADGAPVCLRFLLPR